VILRGTRVAGISRSPPRTSPGNSKGDGARPKLKVRLKEWVEDWEDPRIVPTKSFGKNQITKGYLNKNTIQYHYHQHCVQ